MTPPGKEGSGAAGRTVTVAGAAGTMYLLANLAEVWRASRLDQARPVQAIVVLGAAQRHGRPSPTLAARLDHAHELWLRGLSDLVVVTGGRTGDDRYSEAAASASYLARLGIPDAHVLRETEGRNTWQSLTTTAAFLQARHRERVLLVSDPFHNARIARMAAELGLEPFVSPTLTSPVGGLALMAHFAKEAVEVAIGRVTGFGRLVEVGGRLLGQRRRR